MLVRQRTEIGIPGKLEFYFRADQR
jgi:hypothetical protein